MSDHSHQENHSSEKKPVAFTVPLILAGVFIFIMIMVLSVCDGKHHGDCEEKCSHEQCQKEGHECTKECEKKCAEEEAEEEKSEMKSETKDSETGAAKEEKKEEEHHH